MISLNIIPHFVIASIPFFVLSHNSKELHLLIQILALLFVLEVRDEVLDGFYHLGLGEVFGSEDILELGEERIYL